MGFIELTVKLLPVVPIAVVFAIRNRWWWLMAMAALIVYPVALVSHMPNMAFWLTALVLLAAAVSLRWHASVAVAIGFLAAAAAVWGVVIVAYAIGPRGQPYYLLLLIANLVGLLALGWARPPWRTWKRA